MARKTTNSFPTKTPRKLYRGAFRDLEVCLAQEIAGHKKQHGPLAPLHVICATRLLALHLQRTLGRVLPHGHIHVRFSTLNDFNTQQPAPPLGLELLCQRFARETFPADGYFAPVREMAGFATALLATFTDLQEAGVTPDAFRHAAKTPKLRELATGYAEFCSWLEEHHFVTETVSLPSSVFLYGFYDLNAAQRAFVQRLQPATIFFPAGNEFARPLFDWFQTHGYTTAESPISNLQSPISLLSCPGEPSEVREALRTALSWLREHPDRTFNDIAILCRSRDQYDALFRDTFQHLGIPAFIRGGRPLAEHPDAKLLLLLLETIASDFSRAHVMELACHGDARSHWDAFTLELGIIGGREQWRERVARDPRAKDLSAWLEGLFRSAEAIPSSGSWPAFIPPVLNAWRSLGGQHPGIAAAVQSLADLEPFQPRVTLAEFAACCQKALEQQHEPTRSFEDGGIFVGDVMNARGLSWPLVIVLGLVEKSFPRVIREDPLLLDDERQQISPDLPLKRHSHNEERLLFALATTAASEQLVLSYPRLDASTARPRVPSFLLLEATGASDFKALENLPNHHRVPLSAFTEAEPAVDERELDLAALHALHDGDDYLSAISPLVFAGVQGEHTRWRKRSLTRHDGLMEAKSARQLLCDRFDLDKLVISATSLEDFFGCPFYYFQKHVLHIQPWEEPEASVVIDPAELGSLYHAILEDFYRNGGDLSVVIENHLRHFEQHGVTGYPTVWEIKKEIIRQELAAFVAREQRRLGGEWKPSEFEKEFHNLAVAPPVRLRGKIDRIDLSADGLHARVLDYKTGRLPRGLKDDSLAAGEALQLPLYLIAAQQLLPGVTVEEAAYCYFTLRGGYRNIGFSRAALEARRKELTGLLETAAGMIRDGCFAQFATDGCRNCDFRPICGNGILKLYSHKAEDERMAAFRDIKENVS